jgi:hypothetical protein
VALSEAEVHWRAFLDSLIQRGLKFIAGLRHKLRTKIEIYRIDAASSQIQALNAMGLRPCWALWQREVEE